MQKKNPGNLLKVHCIFSSSFLLFNTNYVNLYSCHPPKESLSILQTLREERKKYLGPVSNVIA